MKTFADYLNANKTSTLELKRFNHNTKVWEDITVSTTVTDTEYIISIKDEDAHFPKDMDIADLLSEYVYYKCKAEVRFCEECGKAYDKGYTAGNGDWYCCEECFEPAMDRDYGKGRWRPSEEEGWREGWYEYLNDNNEWEDTGVYYTEWND